MIDNLSPVFFTIAIALMGVRVAPTHSCFGVTCIIFAVAIYGIRAALLQGKYVKSQEELTKTALALLQANDRLIDLSLRDGLTGIHNRRRFDEALQQEWNRSTRTRQALSLLMIDIDCFKALNDLYGHQREISVFAESLRRFRRSSIGPTTSLLGMGVRSLQLFYPGPIVKGPYQRPRKYDIVLPN